MKNIEEDIFPQGSRHTPTLTSILSPGTTVLHSLTAVHEFQRESIVNMSWKACVFLFLWLPL